MAQTAVCAITQASETDAQWGSPEQPRWGCGGQACGAKRSRRSKSHEERSDEWGREGSKRSRRSKSHEERSDEWVREGSKRSETTTEGLSAMPTEGESVAND